MASNACFAADKSLGEIVAEYSGVGIQKYDGLVERFGAFTVEELLGLSRSDLLSAIGAPLNIRLVQLVEEISQQCPPDEFADFSSIVVGNTKVANLSKRIDSLVRHRLGSPMPTVKDMHDYVVGADEAELLRLSRCQLVDMDMKPLADNISEHFPNLLAVDLSVNYFHGLHDPFLSLDKHLLCLLGTKESGRLVNVIGNPLATPDRKDLFTALALHAYADGDASFQEEVVPGDQVNQDLARLSSLIMQLPLVARLVFFPRQYSSRFGWRKFLPTFEKAMEWMGESHSRKAYVTDVLGEQILAEILEEGYQPKCTYDELLFTILYASHLYFEWCANKY